MKLAGGKPWKNILGAEPTGGVSNYLSQTDLKSWISNVPRYQRVKVTGVYDGIDLIFYTKGSDWNMTLWSRLEPIRARFRLFLKA